MSEKLSRLKKLKSAKTDINYKQVELKGLAELVENLQQIVSEQQTAQVTLLESINKIIEAINTKDPNTDNTEITKAIKELQLAIINGNASPPVDYQLSGSRDKNGLIKLDTIKFKAIAKKGLH